MQQEPKPSFSPSRRWFMRLTIVLAVVSAIALVVMVNYLGAGHFKRFQWSSHSRVELSPQTVRILQSLTNDVNITIFFDPRDQTDLYSMVSALLAEYRNANPRHVNLRMVDYTRFVGEARSVLTRHNLTALESRDFVIFESQGRTATVSSQGMVDYDWSGLRLVTDEAREIRRTAFRGEMLFTAAIFRVIYPRPIKAYFLGGHGEHDPHNTGKEGYSKFASVLKDENNIDWERITLHGTNAIPVDCQLLIIAGPMPSRSRFSDAELEKIDQYLRQGGRLLALLNNGQMGGPSGLERLLERWSIGATDVAIHDPDYSLTGQDLVPAILHGDHPVIKPLAAEDLNLHLVLPRAVGRHPNAPQGAGAPEVRVLVRTSEGATDGRMANTGSFPLMASVQQGGIKGVNTERGETRLLVVGDSLFLNNEVIESLANRYFASFAVNWLVDRPQVLIEGIVPRPITEYKLLMTRKQMRSVQWLLLALMPAAVLVFGGVVWLRRRW